MKKLLTVLALSLPLLATPVAAHAQTVAISPHLFGINYWYYDYASNIDNFNTRKEAVRSAGVTFVRLGGNAPNHKLALSDLDHFDTAIDRVRAIGATPLVQLPINLPLADIPTWIAHFRARGIRYWTLGNEPDPSSNFSEWYKGIPVGAGTTIKRENGNTYSEFRDKFVRLARAVKAADPAAIVVGPDFRQWWGTSSASAVPSEPLLSYYPAFIADVGALSENGVPLLDIFAFHFYGYHNEAENRKRTDLVQTYLDSVNAGRASPLRMAVGEVNAVTSTSITSNPAQIQTWGFDAGQFLVMMTKNVVANRGEFVAPWSVYESAGNRGATDFSTFNANGGPRSTMVHFSLLARHRHAFYMPGSAAGDAYANALVQFGMTDAGGSTVMLMNTSSSERTYAARLDNQYPTGAADVRLRFASTGLNDAGWLGSLPAKTTVMLTFDAHGKRLMQSVYDKAASDAGAGPVVTDLTVGASVAGSRGVVTLAAVLPAGAPRAGARFLVDDIEIGTVNAPPFVLPVDSTSLANGPHTLRVIGYDAYGNGDVSNPLPFSIANPVDVTAQVKVGSTPLLFNRTSQSFVGSITLVNQGHGIAGPLRLSLHSLTPGVGLINASGSVGGVPYLEMANGLAAGASASFRVSFSNPARGAVQYVTSVHAGTF